MSTGPQIEPVKLTKDDFESSQDVRWCPGCGDYSVLATVQRFLPSLGIPPEKYVFVSGIGCSSRFPYYVNTYGFHTIHGRAPAVATGIKIANPDLHVWVITGDGDALSIGGNHLIHVLRRNLNLNILLFNNRIYGLTKGQYSPTSEIGKVTKSTPSGSADYPLNPLLLALGSQATFVARTLDVDAKHMTSVLQQAVQHKGASFIEIYQNCNIFNDGAFDNVSDRDVRAENQLLLEQGKPLIFGKTKDKGIKLEAHGAQVVKFDPSDSEGWKKAGVSVFDNRNANIAAILARLPEPPAFPVPMGVFYQEQRQTLEETLQEQAKLSRTKNPLKGTPDENLRGLFEAGDTWVVG